LNTPIADARQFTIAILFLNNRDETIKLQRSAATAKRSKDMPAPQIADGRELQAQARRMSKDGGYSSVADLPRSSYARVLCIFTGGTIGMKSSPNGFIPVRGYMHEVLAQMAPFHDKSFADPSAEDPDNFPDFVTPPSKFGKRAVYNILEYNPVLDSCNMDASDWKKIATDIQTNYDKYDAFIVLHGTDTMSYTASALSFMLENLSKTVIVTGSQVPLSVPLNDGISNLLGALAVATHYEIPEVLLYFNSKAMRGNRTIKGDASDYDAFKSPNHEPLVKIGVDYEVRWQAIVPAPTSPLALQCNFEGNIAVFRLFPGFCVSSLDNLMQPPLRGLVLQTFGAGNAPDGNAKLIKALKAASDRGVVIVNITQCTQVITTILSMDSIEWCCIIIPNITMRLK
jgi:lysophospholipase